MPLPPLSDQRIEELTFEPEIDVRGTVDAIASINVALADTYEVKSLERVESFEPLVFKIPIDTPPLPFSLVLAAWATQSSRSVRLLHDKYLRAPEQGIIVASAYHPAAGNGKTPEFRQVLLGGGGVLERLSYGLYQ